MNAFDRPLMREALFEDTTAICNLLAVVGLSTEGVLLPRTRYWLIEDSAGELAGVVGLELGMRAALMRSAVVVPHWRSQGLGARMVEGAFLAARRLEYTRVYMFSTGSGAYWQRRGFYEVQVPELVAALPDVPQVRQYQRQGTLDSEIAWRLDI